MDTGTGIVVGGLIVGGLCAGALYGKFRADDRKLEAELAVLREQAQPAPPPHQATPVQQAPGGKVGSAVSTVANLFQSLGGGAGIASLLNLARGS